VTQIKLDQAPRYFRAQPTRTAPERVDREARVIRGVSVITRGEALGHGVWIDEEFLSSVATFSARGLKSRFTHPGLSSDGTGKALGRVHGLRKQGDKVVGDLHLLDAASRAPDGDLAGYVMDLASEDPELFGTSIVFAYDHEAEKAFTEAHSDDDGFQSPDELNTKNLPHARLKALKACDVVDDPAANPGGFFSAAGDVAEQATGALAYVLGLSEQSPGADAFGGVHPDRARQFVTRFMTSQGLTLEHRKAAPMPPETDSAAPPAAAPPAKVVATLASLTAAYTGQSDFILECLSEKRSDAEAAQAWTARELKQLREDNAALRKGKAEAEALAATADAGAPPVAFGSSDQGGCGNFVELARAIRDERHPNLTPAQRATGYGMKAALSEAAKTNSTSYSAFRRAAPLAGRG